MPVVDRYGHFGGVARLVGDNDFLLAVCGSEGKAVVFVKRDLCAVHGDGVHILFVNGDRLRLAVSLSVLNAGDHRPNIVKRYAVGAKVCYVQALVNEHCINNMLPAGVYVERLLVPAEYEGFQFLFGKIPIGHQIRDKHGSAVVGGVYRHRLRILKEQTEGELIQEFLPFIGTYDNFARGLFGVFPPCFERYILGRHGFGNCLIPADEGVALSFRGFRCGNYRAVVLRNRSNLAAAGGVEGNCVFIRVPHGIERQRLVLRINIIKTVNLFAAVCRRPAYLRVPRASEQSTSQRESIVIELNIRYRIAVAVFSGLIGHIPSVCDTHIGLARKLTEDGVKLLSECVVQRGKLFICQRVVTRQIALIQFLHFSGKLRHVSLCGILCRRAREQPCTVAHFQIADILIPQRNCLRIARYGKRAAVYIKIVRCQTVSHGDAVTAVLGVSPKRQCAVQRQRAVAENGKGVIALDNSVQASDGILSVQRDKERTLISDILFAQPHRGQVGILELQIRENTAVPFKPAGRINFQNILACQIH